MRADLKSPPDTMSSSSSGGTFLTVAPLQPRPARRRSASVHRFENPPASPPAGLRPASSLVSLGPGAADTDWSLSTSRRNFRFTQEGFTMARSAPIVHQPTLRIGLEGLREFRVSKSEDYPAYPQREISSARPGGRYRPSSVTTGRAVEGPLLHRSESRDRYSGLASPPATSAATSGQQTPARPNPRSRPPDQATQHTTNVGWSVWLVTCLAWL